MRYFPGAELCLYRKPKTENRKPSSYPPDLRSPDIFVELQVQPQGQAAGQNPGGGLLKRDLPEYRRNQHRQPLGQAMAVNHLQGPGEIRPVGHHELDFIPGGQEVQVAPSRCGRPYRSPDISHPGCGAPGHPRRRWAGNRWSPGRW